MSAAVFKRGDLVEYWFDTGAFGFNILYGKIIASGEKCYRVMWESGLTNRLRHEQPGVKIAEDQALAATACAARSTP